MAQVHDDEHDAPCDCSGSDGQLTRRNLVAGSASLGLAVVGCASRGEKWTVTPVTSEKGVVALPVTDHPPLATAGGMVAVHPPGLRRPVVVMRLEGDQFRVMSLKCPHLGCTVRWNAEEQTLGCPCHGSRFDDDGNPTKGPAKSALTQYPATFRELTVRFKVDEDAK
ncbi:MAG: Rieske 2Fe-2S domain-containing protein [Myxococcota bacterium]